VDWGVIWLSLKLATAATLILCVSGIPQIGDRDVFTENTNQFDQRIEPRILSITHKSWSIPPASRERFPPLSLKANQVLYFCQPLNPHAEANRTSCATGRLSHFISSSANANSNR